MADRIEKSDLFGDFDLSAEISSLKAILVTIDQIKSSIKDVAGKKIIDVKDIDTSTLAGLKELAKEKKNINKIAQESKIILSEEQKLKEKLAALETEQAKRTAELKVAISEKNKINREEAILISSATSEYQKQQVRLNQLTKMYNELAFRGRENGKVAKALAAEIQNLDSKFKTVDATGGKFNRHVGDYTNQLRALQKEMQGLEPGTKQFNDLAKQAGALKDRINDAKDATAAFAKDSRSATAKTLFGQVVDDFKNLDFKGAADKAKVLSDVVSGMTFAETSEGVKSFGSALLNLGKAVFLNPLILIAGAVTALGAAVYETYESFQFANDIQKEYNDTLGKNKERIEELTKSTRDLKVENQALAGVISESEKKRILEGNKFKDEYVRIKLDEAKKIKELNERFAKENEKTFTEQALGPAGALLFGARIKQNLEARKNIITQIQKETNEELIALSINYRERIKGDNLEEIKKTKEENKNKNDDFLKAEEEKMKEAQEVADRLSEAEFKKQEELNKKIQQALDDQKQYETNATQTALDEQLEAQAAFVKSIEELKKKQKEQDKNNLKDTVKNAQQAYEVFSSLIKKRQERNLASLEKELNDSKSQEDNLKRLAEQRILFADESLAVEKQKQKDIEKEKQKIASRQQLLEATSAALQLMGNYAKNGSQQPFEDAFKDVTALLAAVRGLQFFSEGTEKVKGGKPKKDSVLSMLMPGERVVDEGNNQKIGTMTNDDLADLAYSYRTGALNNISKIPDVSMEQKQWKTGEELIKRMEDIEQAIKDKPVPMIDPHALAGFITQRIITHNKTERNHYKNSNIFN